MLLGDDKAAQPRTLVEPSPPKAYTMQLVHRIICWFIGHPIVALICSHRLPADHFLAFRKWYSIASVLAIDIISMSTDESSSDSNSFNFQFYRYTPNLGLAIAATVVFAVLTLVHAWLLRKARAYYFTPFLIGGICKSPSISIIRFLS